MRGARIITSFIVAWAFLCGWAIHAESTSTSHSPTGKIAKVLTLLMDTNGLVATSPSLYDRDAYQAFLNQHTNLVSGVRVDICWSVRHGRGQSLNLRVELLGIGNRGFPTEVVLNHTVRQKLFSHWISLTLAGAEYKKLGTLSAWRATLWNGNQKLAEQKSFLWSL